MSSDSVVRKFRYAFLVSGEGRMMEIALRACREQHLDFEITLVVTDRNCGAATRATAHGVPMVVLDYAGFGTREEFDAALYVTLDRADIDGVILNFNRLISPAVQARFPERILNTHFSLLPLFPGFGAIQQTISSGMLVAGVTVHLVDEGVDAGPIIAQLSIGNPPDGSAEELGRRLFDAAVPMQLQAWQWLAQGRIRRLCDRKVQVTGADYTSAGYVPALESPFV